MKFIEDNEIFLLEEIVKRNFLSKYKDSVLGILWTIVNPLLMMALFTIVFSTILGRYIDNYPLYFLCGWCVFNFFSPSVSGCMNALKGNKHILNKIPAPKHIFILGSIISEFLTFLIMLVLLIGVMIITHAPFFFPHMLFSLIPIFSLFIMIVGLGLMMSIVSVYYSDVQHLWSVVSMMIMYASGIFYRMEIIPQPYRQYLILNPLYWIIHQFRCFVYYGVFPRTIDMLNSVLLSLIILVIGIIVFKKYENRINIKF